MQQNDLLGNNGRNVFFDALNPVLKQQLIFAWKRAIDPDDRNNENETLSDIFVAATHIIPNSLEICTPLHNTEGTADFFKVTFERQAKITDMDAEDIAALLIRAYDRIFETGKSIKETVTPIKDGAIALYPFTILH